MNDFSISPPVGPQLVFWILLLVIIAIISFIVFKIISKIYLEVNDSKIEIFIFPFELYWLSSLLKYKLFTSDKFIFPLNHKDILLGNVQKHFFSVSSCKLVLSDKVKVINNADVKIAPINKSKTLFLVDENVTQYKVKQIKKRQFFNY